MSWEPLAPTAPIPGDPEVVAAGARRYATVAEAMSRAEAALGRINFEGQQSEAIDELRKKTKDIQDVVTKARGRYAAASEALGAYAVAHRDAQEDALDLLIQAQAAESDLQAAERSQSRASDDNDVAVSTATASGGAPDPAAAATLQAATASVNSKRGTLGAIIARLPGIVETWHTAAGIAANKIDDGVSADDLNDGWWENWGSKVANWVSDVFKEIAGWAGIVALILAWVPGLGQALAVLALVTGAIALVADISLLVAGEGRWFDVIMGAVGLLSFGIGRGATKVAQTTVKAATRAAARSGNPAIRAAAPAAERAAAGVARWNPVKALQSFSGLKGKPWVLNAMGQLKGAHMLQAIQATGSTRAHTVQIVEQLAAYTPRFSTVIPFVSKPGVLGLASLSAGLSTIGSTVFLSDKFASGKD